MELLASGGGVQRTLYHLKLGRHGWLASHQRCRQPTLVARSMGLFWIYKKDPECCFVDSVMFLERTLIDLIA